MYYSILNKIYLIHAPGVKAPAMSDQKDNEPDTVRCFFRMEIGVKMASELGFRHLARKLIKRFPVRW